MSNDILEFHRSLLIDERRTLRFREAIEATVRPGDVVVDVGAGTGVLALFAAAAGARRVFAIESAPVIELARAVAARTEWSDRVELVEGPSFATVLPEPADVVISETIGSLGLDEGIVRVLADARARFLKPGGRIVPCAVELHVAPVEHADAYARRIDWAGERYGIDFVPLRRACVNASHREPFEPEHLLGPAGSLGAVDLERAEPRGFAGNARLSIARAGTLHGLAVWFSARLADGVSITNAPPTAVPSWSQAFLPLDRPVEVARGDGVRADVRCTSDGRTWSWRVRTEPAVGGTGADISHSTFVGCPMSAARLHRVARESRPALNEDGEIMRRALGLVDGTRTLEEVANLLQTGFPDRFPDVADALDYVRALCASLAR